MATGIPRSRARSIGFTLIELLVVITIIAIVLSVALLSVNLVRDDRDLQTEGRRFAALLAVAIDEASLQGREFGIEIMRSGYRFVEYDTVNGVWMELMGDDVLRLRELPEDTQLELYMEDKRVLLDNRPAEFDDPEKMALTGVGTRYAPHILVYSSGEVTPFDLRFWRQSDEKEFLLRSNVFGEVEFGEPQYE